MRATRNNFGLFLVYYFPHYIQYEFAPHHYDMIEDIHDLIDGRIKELAWFQYRESAKTSFAKILIIFLIAHDLDYYINADAYDKSNAERVLFDVVLEMQTNHRLKQDFGDLYNTARSKEEATQKRVSDFITNPKKNSDGNIIRPGIRVEAHSTQEPVRGRIHGAYRPGFLLLDDFETKKTIKSETITKSIADHISEFKGGLDSTRRRVLYLGNYISEHANVEMLIKKAKVDPELRVRIVPIIDNEGNVAWPAKYVRTDEEAKQTGKVSIEAKRRSMWTPDEGDSDFMAEMLCQPIDFANSVFKREYFQYITFEKLREKMVACYVTIDPPGGKENRTKDEKKKKRDYAGFCINWADQEGKWYIKAYRKQLGPTQLLEEMFGIYDFLISNGTPAIKMGWEDTAYTRALEITLRRMMRERQKFLPIVWLKTKGRNKYERIRSGLLYRYESRSIFHLQHECNDLENELMRYPEAENDDCCDATSYQSDIAKRAGQEKSRGTAKSAYEDDDTPDDDDDEDLPDERPQFPDIGI